MNPRVRSAICTFILCSLAFLAALLLQYLLNGK